jgi:hypothetical protein
MRRQQEQPTAYYDPEMTLVWWRGSAYVRTPQRLLRDMTTAQRRALESQQALDVIYESRETIDGTWRRAFEQDLALDQQDSSNRGAKKFFDEITAEIGCLADLDGDKIVDRNVFRTSNDKVPFGAFVDESIVPAEWRDQVTYFRDLEERVKEMDAQLRAGKKADQREMEAFMSEAQRRGAEATSRGGRGGRGVGREGTRQDRNIGRNRGAGAGYSDTEGKVEETTGPARRWQPGMGAQRSQAAPQSESVGSLIADVITAEVGGGYAASDQVLGNGASEGSGAVGDEGSLQRNMRGPL